LTRRRARLTRGHSRSRATASFTNCAGSSPPNRNFFLSRKKGAGSGQLTCVRQAPPPLIPMKRILQRMAGVFVLLAANGAVVANHVHLQVAWRQSALVLEIYDFEAGVSPADAYPFVLGNAGMKL